MTAQLFVAGGRLAGAPGGAPSVLRIEGGRIAELLPAVPDGAPRLDAGGRWLSPLLVDAHVHLAFAAEQAGGSGPGGLEAVARRLLRSGVGGALDLGMPEALLAALPPLSRLPFAARSSGPLFTAPGGYPTRSWGRDGYGLAVASAREATEAVARLVDAGAAALKLAFDRRFPVLAPEVARAAAAAGRRRGLAVFAHALDAQAVRAALDAGAGVLAHAPTGPLCEELVREAGARGVAVVSTLHACGGGAEALRNLQALRAAGCPIVFGTDLGNEGTAPGLCAPEIELLARAGLDAAAIFSAATERAAALLGAPELARLAPGAPANLLALDRDPLADPAALARPVFALVGGEQIRLDAAAPA